MMMRRAFLPRLAGVLAAYCLVFAALTMLQFAKQDGFTKKIGALVVTGRYKITDAHFVLPDENMGNVDVPVENPVNVFFAGLEFRIGSDMKDPHQLSYLDFDQIHRPVMPVSMNINAKSVRFKLTDGSELSFYVNNNGSGDELIISNFFSEDATMMELPYILTKNARVASIENSGIVVLYDRKEYTFDRRIIDTEREFVELSNANPVVAYRIIPEEARFNPVEFIVSGAMDKRASLELSTQWFDKAYREWNARIASSRDEKLIIAFVAEAARRGNYPAAVARIAPDFISGAAWTFRSSPFTGRLESAMRGIAEFEHGRTGAVETKIRTQPLDLLSTDNDFEYLAQRSISNLFDEGIEFIKTIQPDYVSLEMLPALFEGWWVFNTWRPNLENPFEMLVNQARLFVSESIYKDAADLHVFIVENGRVDVLYNIRLGAALAAYGEAGGSNEWAAVGRSLILSALSFSDDSGAIYTTLELDANNVFTERAGAPRIAAAEIYEVLKSSDYYPHTVGAGTVMQGVYLWTVSPAIGAAYRNSVLEFDVSFPVGGTHHLMIRGLKPFKKIQMRGMDYRSDPQFERYNSPGWVYSPAEQTLLIKLVHRTEIEAIKIFY
jgi:hypothetical protein